MGVKDPTEVILDVDVQANMERAWRIYFSCSINGAQAKTSDPVALREAMASLQLRMAAVAFKAASLHPSVLKWYRVGLRMRGCSKLESSYKSKG